MAAPLNHSAARHKIAIRPKRNHAPARPRQLPQVGFDFYFLNNFPNNFFIFQFFWLSSWPKDRWKTIWHGLAIRRGRLTSKFNMFNRRYRSARIALADSCDPSQFPLELSLNCVPSPCHGRKTLPSKRLPFTRPHPVPILAAAATQLVLSRRLDLRRSNLPGASLASRRRSSTKWPSFGAVPKRVNSSRRKRPPTKKGQPMLIRYNRLVTFPLQLFPSFHPLMK